MFCPLSNPRSLTFLTEFAPSQNHNWKQILVLVDRRFSRWSGVLNFGVWEPTWRLLCLTCCSAWGEGPGASSCTRYGSWAPRRRTALRLKQTSGTEEMRRTRETSSREARCGVTFHHCPPPPICLVPVTHWLLQGLNAHTISTLMQLDKQHEQELLFIALTTAAVCKSPETNKKEWEDPAFALFLSLCHMFVWQTSIHTHTHTFSGAAPSTRHKHPVCVYSPVFPMVLTQEAQDKPASAVWSSSVSVCQLSPAFSPPWSSETFAEDPPTSFRSYWISWPCKKLWNFLFSFYLFMQHISEADLSFQSSQWPSTGLPALSMQLWGAPTHMCLHVPANEKGVPVLIGDIISVRRTAIYGSEGNPVCNGGCC